MKKILISLLAGAVMTTAFAISAMAAGDTTADADDAVAKIGDQYYTTVDKAMADANESTDEEVVITILKDVANLPSAKVRGGITFEATTAGIKVTGRANLPNHGTGDVSVATGVFTWSGFDFSEMTDWAFCPWDANSLAGCEFVIKNCTFGAKAFGAWEAQNRYQFEKLTISGCTFISSANQNLLSIQHGKEIVVEDCDFTGYTGTSAAINMAAYSGNLTLDNNDFGSSYVQLAQNLGDYPRSLTVTDCKFTGTMAVNVHSNFTNADTDIDTLTITENTYGTTTPVITFPSSVDAEAYVEANFASVVLEDNVTHEGEEVTDIIVPVGGVAKIGNVYYASLQEAIAAADKTKTAEENVIDLLGNTIVIDVYKDSYHAGKSLTFTNGTLDFSYAGAPTALFWLSGSQKLIFDDVDIIKQDVGTDRKYMFNLIQVASPNASVSFIDCDIDLDGGYDSANKVGMASSYIANDGNGTMYFTRCNIECEYTNFVYRGGATFDTCTFDGYAERDDGEEIAGSGNIIMWAANPCVIKNSTVKTRTLSVIAAAGTIALTEGTSVEAQVVKNYYAPSAAEYTTNHITVDATSSLMAETIDMGIVNTEASAGTIVSKADSIEVVFEKVDEEEVNGEIVDTKEGEDLYNINLVGANAEIINRLNSADLTFKLTSVHDMAYEIIASNEEVAVNPVNNSADRYEFHYEGKDGVKTDVANVITIGQVKFTGYGEYDFVIVADAPNAAHATTISDNIVDTFVPNAEDGVQEGELIITNKIEDAYITVPTRDLIINVDFPNAIVEQVIAYNDMTVVISGGDLAKAIEIKLGSDAAETEIETENDKADAKYVADFVDGAYVVNVTDVLTVNSSYNVEVSGAGYRTARYTVTMNCDESKTLNFWNNVKDNAINVEEGKESSKKNVTFLAGDIVKDSIINVYDLSAVVSYFGEIDLNKTGEQNDYAKYDLNRDGKIDSKDVAYVLVSWGN